MVPFTTPDTSNPRHVKPQTHQTPDTSNLRHIKPQTKNIGLPTTQQIKIPFHILIEILFENLKINRIFTWNIKRYFYLLCSWQPYILRCVWGLMCLRFDVSGVWCVWGLTCLGLWMAPKGFVNPSVISFVWNKMRFLWNINCDSIND